MPAAAPFASSTRALWGRAALGYALLACAVTWPLPLHLQTHVIGDVAGDLGVYIWNLWVFSHELIGHGHLPFATDHVFAYTDGADFALHNYTPIVGLFGVPLVPLVGVVTAFNLILLGSIATAGLALFALARRLGLPALPAFCAGAVFLASPVLVAKQTAHTSLVMAAPLPLFLICLLRALETRRVRDALGVGALVAVATYADAYFGIYCVLMGLALLVARFVGVRRTAGGREAALVRTLASAIGIAAAATVAANLLGVTTLTLGPVRLSARTLYTPMLGLVAAVAMHALTRVTLVLTREHVRDIRALLVPAAAAVATTAVLLSPMIAGVINRAINGRLPATPVYWRSSPRGVDLLAPLVPNPNLDWLSESVRHAFLPPQGDAFPEFVGSWSLVGIVLLLWAVRQGALPRLWLGFTALFAGLSVGPFIHVGGVNTQVIGPWALLRYVPVIGMARSPSRFAIVATLGFALLVGFALHRLWSERGPRSLVGLAAALLLAVELLPVPRVLHSAAAPEAYRFIAADPRPGRVIELPTGMRDGTSSMGDFNPATMFYQTVHERPILGGYLSRISPWRQARVSEDWMLRVLYRLSARRDGTAGRGQDHPRSAELEDDLARRPSTARERFLSRACLGFVVIDRDRASAGLSRFAVEVLGLERVFADGRYDVFVPVDPPPCRGPEPRERTHRFRQPTG